MLYSLAIRCRSPTSRRRSSCTFLVFIFIGVYNNKFTTIDELNQLAKSTDVVNAKTIADITYHIAFVCNQV